MEIRLLKYFLVVSREQNITNAAKFLHITQPTLSRQLRELEDEFGKQLFIRGNRKITLTEDGMLLRKRAQEIVELSNKTISEIKNSNDKISGDIYIGCGESNGLKEIIKVMMKTRDEYPNIRFHISSGDKSDILEKLDKGLIDFAVCLDPIDKSNYSYYKVPTLDHWGILMRKDSSLASKDFITKEDLTDKPLIVSRQSASGSEINTWLKKPLDKLNIVATYNLAYNASLMVSEGFGYAFCLDKIINTNGSDLKFVPLKPSLDVEMYIMWPKYQIFSKAVEKFLENLDTFFTKKEYHQ